MPSLTEFKNANRRTILAYGKAGCGKTSLLMDFPGKTKIFDFDLKLGSGVSVLKAKNPERIKNIDYHSYPLGQTGESKRPFRQFTNDLNKFGEEIDKYDNVMIDSVTTLAYFLMHEEMEQRPGKADRDVMNNVKVPNLKDYQVSITYFKHLLSTLISLPVNVLVTAHDMQVHDEASGTITNTLAIWGKDLPTWIPKTFEEVYYMYTKTDIKTKKVSRFIQTAEARRFVARSQVYDIPLEICVDNGYSALKKYYEAS